MSGTHPPVGNLNSETGPKSVTQHLPGLLAGRKEAIQALWERFCGPCRILARRRLGHAGRLIEEDDVVTEACLSFCTAARAGKFPDLSSRDNVIRLLAAFTMRKAFDARRKVIRRGNKVRIESVLGALGFEPFESRDPPPEFEAEVDDLLGRLETEELRSIAAMRIKGHSPEEIAAQHGCSVATVRRRLSIIHSRLAEAPDVHPPRGESPREDPT
jgi:DNA-directed RNA polymerase specialized sigma24 family protein